MMKKNKFLGILVLVFIPIFCNAQIGVDLPLLEEKDITDFKLINKFRKLPKVVKKNFRKHNRRPCKLFVTIFDDDKYEFKWGAIADNLYIIHFKHTGLGDHFHCSVFDLNNEEISISTYDTIREIKSLNELLNNK